MKAIMVMFDTLNRRMLPPYGCDWVHAPNFQRLAERAVRFNHAYAGSMPCMPARREIHNGRYHFLHRSWGPLEPFDDSMPELLKRNGIWSHLVSDHFHYWEEGGATYHTRYKTWECSRGLAGDPWIGRVRPPRIPETLNPLTSTWTRQDWVNREYLEETGTHPVTTTFDLGLRFLQENCREDKWFLHLETFGPHEPYYALPEYRKYYPHDYSGPHFDWPAAYGPVTQTPDQVRHCRYECAAFVTQCDAQLGRVLDLMDAKELWRDTLLIVNTDHGLLMGERDAWGKSRTPSYNEIAQVPLFIWDPRCGRRGETRNALVQTIDLAPTILEFFGLPIPPDMEGVPLKNTVANDAPVREAGLFGFFGMHVNVTDGRYVYMRAPAHETNRPRFEYTLMPTHMMHTFSVDELHNIQLAPAFAFTKGCRLMKIEATMYPRAFDGKWETLLFDLHCDPGQVRPLPLAEQRGIESRMLAHLRELMRRNDAPPEQYERLGLTVT